MSQRVRRSIPSYRRVSHTSTRRVAPRASRRRRVDGTNDLYDVLQAEHINLWLPSDIPAARRSVVCDPEIVELEIRFRKAELQDALSTLQKYLRFYAILRSRYKAEFGKNSKNITRAREELSSYKRKYMSAAKHYRHTRKALLALDPHGEWTPRFRELKPEDIRGPYIHDDDSDLAATLNVRDRELGRGHFISSWIWTVRSEDDDSEPIEQIQVQWAKLISNAERWDEEIVYVIQEMEWVLASFETEAKQWEARIGARSDPARPWLQASLDAYAYHQAELRIARRDQFAREWLLLLSANQATGTEWTSKYQHLLPESSKKPAPRPFVVQGEYFLYQAPCNIMTHCFRSSGSCRRVSNCRQGRVVGTGRQRGRYRHRVIPSRSVHR
jgi:hypothetical protein